MNDNENNGAELDVSNKNGEYKVEAIRDSAVYVRESESGHLLDLYYLVSWKRYPKEKNTWEPASAVQHLRKLISLFHKNHPDKATATFLIINTAPPMTRPTFKFLAKQKRGQPIRRAKKRAKWGDKGETTRKRRQKRGEKKRSKSVQF